MAFDRSVQDSTAASKHAWLKALLAGFLIMLGTYLAALACAAAQLHSAVVILMWPTFLLTRLMPAGEPVTPDTPSGLWLPLAGIAFAWLIYSVATYFWLGRRANRGSA